MTWLPSLSHRKKQERLGDDSKVVCWTLYLVWMQNPLTRWCMGNWWGKEAEMTLRVEGQRVTHWDISKLGLLVGGNKVYLFNSLLIFVSLGALLISFIQHSEIWSWASIWLNTVCSETIRHCWSPWKLFLKSKVWYYKLNIGTSIFYILGHDQDINNC